MRRIPLQAMVCVLIVLGGILNIPTLHSELIEPTRTLQKSPDQPGSLSVFSEPPALEIWLDGKQAGMTPLVSAPIQPGEHLLRLGDTERRINITPGKPSVFSWFKGSLIEVKERTEPSTSSQSADSSQKPKQKVIESVRGTYSAPNDPFYWPLNPRGPIY